MAAMLIEIKSRMLLPRPSLGEAEEDPRAELVRRLLEYEQMKLAAQRLNELPQAGRDFSLVQVLFEQNVADQLPDVSSEDLRSAWLCPVDAGGGEPPSPDYARGAFGARPHEPHPAPAAGLALRRFSRTVRPGAAAFPMLVVTFLAILELARESLIEVSQQAAYAPIYVKLKGGHLAAVE